MYFTHADAIWDQHPNLRALALSAEDVRDAKEDPALFERLTADIQRRQAGAAEAEMPEIAAWREAFSRMGLKPTQYRCASEALLRRFRKSQDMPTFHPLVDYLNYVSMAYGIPIAVFDRAHVVDGITVRPAEGTESYETFQGEVERPGEGEVVFADPEGHAHSRRWTYRQSARSVVSGGTDKVLIVAEAHHGTADTDLLALEEELRTGIPALGARITSSVVLGAPRQRFEFS